ncbi:outer membrane lipoprotein Blc [Klebsiella pneumoniae]|uniref:Outer membrane lipoprotein Blc n=1 Tax=Klebsiella pneumoniae TaxID=573 RepID=A0A377TL42_KLEPN|nr:outer membrane lipoprotein Blc [Klebsiella pneumoniae]
MRILPIITAIAVSFLSVACSTPRPPPGVTVVSPFDVQRYLGTWYEIARFDHPFESGLEKVTIAWHPRVDGGLDVVNKGYNPDRGMWQKTDGVAYFTGEPSRAALKISFFGLSTAAITSLLWIRSIVTRWSAARSRLSLAPGPGADHRPGGQAADAGHCHPTGL